VSNDLPIAECRVSGGAQLTLYPNRVVLHGGKAAETVALGQLASVRVAFEREPRKLRWALILGAIAVLIFWVARPLHGLAVSAAAEVAESIRRESASGGVPPLLLATFNALASFARALPKIGTVLVLWAGALGLLWLLGVTTLTLSFAAVERVFKARGRHRELFEFGEAVGTEISERGD
jgi:hypothetical protein